MCNIDETENDFAIEKITLESIELSLGEGVHVNVHKYEFMHTPTFKKLGELSFSTAKDKGLIFSCNL